MNSNKKQAKTEWTAKKVEDTINEKANDVERKIEDIEKRLTEDDYVTTKAPEKKVTEAITVTETAPVTEAESEEETIEETEAAEAETVLDLSQLSNIKEAIENGDYSLVTPEFKASMDEYEAFYDEYLK